MKRDGLRDAQFSRIEHLLSGRLGSVGGNSEQGAQIFVEDVIWTFRSEAS